MGQNMGSVPLRPGENSENSKITILFIVWYQCVLLCFNSYMIKLSMFKIEYLWILMRLSPVPTFRAFENMWAVMLQYDQ